MLAIINATKQTSLGAQIRQAGNFSERLLGLLALRRLPFGQGLFIPDCKSVHTIGMRFGLDIILLDRQNRVIQTLEGVKPNRLVFAKHSAHAVLELPEGLIQESATCMGDLLEIQTF